MRSPDGGDLGGDIFAAHLPLPRKHNLGLRAPGLQFTWAVCGAGTTY